MMQLSIIIPTLNESESIQKTLNRLQPYRDRNLEIILVDGGSRDSTVEIARPLVDIVHRARRGRAIQMNTGACFADSKYLLFLHADTHFPKNAFLVLKQCIAEQSIWGRFNVKLSGSHPLLRAVEILMNIRSRLSGIATGDQAIFVRKKEFDSIGGFPDLPLMEDIAISRKLRDIAKPRCLREKVISSSRRWEENGILRTILLMWSLRLRFYMGVDPSKLARKYS